MGWKSLICVAAAGGIGTCARYGVVTLTQRLAPRHKAQSIGDDLAHLAGTLTVNVLGCFLFGLLWTLLADRAKVQDQTTRLVFVGFLGAFTTFSTFAFEVTDLARSAKWGMAALTLGAHNGLGVLAVLIGMVIGRSL